MMRSQMQRVALSLGFLVGGALTAHTALPAAHAAGSTPSITSIADAAAYGVVEVAGINFSRGDDVQIQMLDVPTGVWHAVAATAAGGSGSFTKIFSFTVSCSALAAGQVSLRAVDTETYETTSSVVQALGTPVSLAQAQMAAAKTKQAVLAAQAALAAAQATMQKQAAAC